MLSVIIPIYNTGKYLDKCISTVSSQSYRDLEIILINDCSSDKKTNEVIEKWVEKDSRIFLINKTHNEGVDKARVSGIYASHGDYLAFVDSDDWLPLDAFESMMQKVLETDADIVKANNANMWLGGIAKKVSVVNPTIAERIIPHEELIDIYYLSFFGVNIIPVTLWGTIYRRSIFFDANIQSTGLRFGEDLVMNMKVFPYVQKFYQMEKVVYYYRQGLPIMSGKYLDNWLQNFNKLYKIKIQQIQDMRYEKAIFYQNVELINYLRSFVLGCNRHRKYNILECITELQNELQDPIYRNLKVHMKEDKWIILAEMIEQADVSHFWAYVTEQNKQRMTFKTKVIEGVLNLISRAIKW